MIEPEAYQYIFNENVYSLENKKTDLRNLKVEFYLKEKKEEYTEFINKIISAINLRPEEVGLQLTSDFSSDDNETGIAIIFDHDFSSNNASELYTKIEQGSQTVLIVDSIEQLMVNTELKRKLWSCLQEIFN